MINDLSLILQACLQIVEGMGSGRACKDSLQLLCNHVDVDHNKLYNELKTYLTPMRNDPIVPLLTIKEHQINSLEELFAKAESECTTEATASLLHAILVARVEPAFHKINVHAALTPSDIKRLFDPVFSQAKKLQETYQQRVEVAMEKKMSVSSVSQQSTFSHSSSFSVSSDHDAVPFVTVRKY